MSLTTKHQDKNECVNKIFVNTKHSNDRRNLEGFWLTYDPKDNIALSVADVEACPECLFIKKHCHCSS